MPSRAVESLMAHLRQMETHSAWLSLDSDLEVAAEAVDGIRSPSATSFRSALSHFSSLGDGAIQRKPTHSLCMSSG